MRGHQKSKHRTMKLATKENKGTERKTVLHQQAESKLSFHDVIDANYVNV